MTTGMTMAMRTLRGQRTSTLTSNRQRGHTTTRTTTRTTAHTTIYTIMAMVTSTARAAMNRAIDGASTHRSSQGC